MDTAKKCRLAPAQDQGAVCLAHHGQVIDLGHEGVECLRSLISRSLTHARLMDGKLLLVTNTANLAPADVVKRYKSLIDIVRSCQVLKSEIEIGPIYHRLPERIRAHAAICFMALILYRVMRTRLHASDTSLSPERALEKLRRIHIASRRTVRNRSQASQ